MSNASSLERWTRPSCCGAWFARLRMQREGSQATVWFWPPGEALSARLEAESATGLENALAPREMSFASLLDFSPSPEGVA
jgi:hypothetical protein